MTTSDQKLSEKSKPRVDSKNASGLYVQYGSGPIFAPAEWTNFDASLTLRFERIPILGRLYTKNANRFPKNTKCGDIVKGLPVPDESCQGVFASHVLEHLSLDHFHIALDNTKRILRPGGIFRLVVPDLAIYAERYVERMRSGDPTANDYFMRKACLGLDVTRPGIIGLFHRAMATSFHYWMWDYPSMMQALHDHGFKQIRRCEFGDCEDPMFRSAELEFRFEDSVAVECRR